LKRCSKGCLKRWVKMIKLKGNEEIGQMRVAGTMLAVVLDRLKLMAKPGITTKELDSTAESLILEMGAEPAFKGYQNFPAALCTSVNEVIVHGVPSDYRLEEGDIISLDLGLKYRGFFADMAVTVPVGEVSPEKKRLIRITRRALKIGIKEAIPGNKLNSTSGKPIFTPLSATIILLDSAASKPPPSASP